MEIKVKNNFYLNKGDRKMKKLLAVLLALTFVFALVACGNSDKPEETKAAEETKEAAETAATEEKGEGVMTYAEYTAAAIDAPVVIEAYVQGKQSWWDNKAIIYLQDKDGGYLAYNAAITEDEYNKLEVGTKVKVTGFKAEWSGEVEIGEGCTVEILEGNYIATATDVTALVGTDDLIKHQNELVAFKGLTVAAQEDGQAFNYKNPTEKTDDIYLKATTEDGKELNLCVEFYLTGKDSDVYKAVEGLKVGDKIDVEGFLYWYNGANPHVTSVVTAK